MAIYLQHFSSIPLLKDTILQIDEESDFTGYDFGHRPNVDRIHYMRWTRTPYDWTKNWPPHNLVATITNVIYKRNGEIDERHWDGKRGPSPADEYFMQNGNR